MESRCRAQRGDHSAFVRILCVAVGGPHSSSPSPPDKLHVLEVYNLSSSFIGGYRSYCRAATRTSDRGNFIGVSGTSCSSPTFAGIVALLNDIRLTAGKSTLGFLNPLFYSNPSVFTDITDGNNPGCGTNGFYCAQGWDPVTGLGTPNFESLSTLVQSLP